VSHPLGTVRSVGGWNPWAALRQRDDVVLARVDLPGGGAARVAWPDGDTVILLDRTLGRSERRAALAHELVHHEQGGACCHPDAIIRRRHEHHVDVEVARRLVPCDELDELVSRIEELDESVTVTEVMYEFDVPVDVAVRALLLLLQRRRPAL
jgi:hypothetical protein